MLTLLEFTDEPPAGGAYLRAVLGAGKPLRADRLPELVALRRNVTVEAAAVTRFRAHFGLADTGEVPPTYAHIVLAAPLHLQVLTHYTFPLRVLGTVHVRNPVTQFRPLRVGEQVHVEVRLGELREVHNGIEYDLHTLVRDAGETLIWCAVSTNLVRDPRLPPRQRSVAAEAPPAPQWERAWPFTLAADAGRRYAAISGDWNPIHLHRLTARLFGFRRAIMHGMYTCTKALAVLEAHLPRGGMAIDVQFRKPLLLPGGAVVRARREDGLQGWQWVVEDRRGEVLHVEGRAGALASDAMSG